MKSHTLQLVVLIAITLSATQTRADMVSNMYHRELPSGLLDDVDVLFPGNGHMDQMDQSMLTADANLYLQEDSIVSLTFIDEHAGFRSSIGYITFDDHGRVIEEAVVFADYSKLDDRGTLTAGDTIDIGRFDAGTNIGFFIIPNGNKTPHYTLDSLNPDQDNYTAFYTHESGYRILGFEDLIDKPSWGCAYNDAIVGITTVATASTPEPTTISLLALGSLAVLSRRRRAKA